MYIHHHAYSVEGSSGGILEETNRRLGGLPTDEMPMTEPLALTKVVPARAFADDHVEVVVRDDGVVLLVLADGAGGQAGGGRAAQRVAAGATKHFCEGSSEIDPVPWLSWMREMDRSLSLDPTCGETTAIVCVVDGPLVGGCSVGDSEAWIFESTSIVDLTSAQRRKPLLGSGQANPHPFFVRRSTRTRGSSTLLLGSDGLFKYASRDRIAELVSASPFPKLLDALVESVRLPTGALHDDVGLIALALER